MRFKVFKVIMFRLEKGVFEWFKLVYVFEYIVFILKMCYFGGDSMLYMEIIMVLILENDDGTFDIRIARSIEIDGVFGMYFIENYLNVLIWYY